MSKFYAHFYFKRQITINDHDLVNPVKYKAIFINFHDQTTSRNAYALNKKDENAHLWKPLKIALLKA